MAQKNPHAYIEKPTAPKTSHCLVRIFVQRHNWTIFFFENELEEAVTVNGDRYRAMLNEFLFTKIKEKATFGFNRTALRATPPKLHLMFCALFLKIALSAAELMSFGHYGAAI